MFLINMLPKRLLRTHRAAFCMVSNGGRQGAPIPSVADILANLGR